MATMNIWTYREETWATTDLSGFDVEAIDGGIGKVDEATHEVGQSYLVIDTGPWIFGKKVILPAGVIDRIDTENETVFLAVTKEEIKSSPELDEATLADEEQRTRVGTYYAGTSTYRGTRGTAL